MRLYVSCSNHHSLKVVARGITQLIVVVLPAVNIGDEELVVHPKARCNAVIQTIPAGHGAVVEPSSVVNGNASAVI